MVKVNKNFQKFKKIYYLFFFFGDTKIILLKFHILNFDNAIILLLESISVIFSFS